MFPFPPIFGLQMFFSIVKVYASGAKAKTENITGPNRTAYLIIRKLQAKILFPFSK